MKIDLKKIGEKFNDVEFFVACIFPPTQPVFTGDQGKLDVVTGENFWMISAKAGSASLIHADRQSTTLFRGYELETLVHSWSEADNIAKLQDEDKLVNGVFSLIRFDHARQQAVIRTDALGFSPLFYREDAGCFLFSSHASLIHKKDDNIDLMSWLSLMQNSFNFGNNGFYEEIKRFPGGSQLTLTPGKKEWREWFDRASLPAGEKKIDDQSFVNVENAFRQAFDRCLALKIPAITLPFSSGYDSRRFFAGLVQRKLPFKAVTCQTYHRKKGRDYEIDSHFAPQIAEKFGVDCELVKAADNTEIENHSRRRNTLIGTETFMAEWAIPLMDWLAKRPTSMVFDGLAGDTFGNSGYEFNGLHETPKKDIDVLVKNTINKVLFKNLSPAFPSYEQYKEVYTQALSTYPDNLNGAELVFLNFRTRRCISPWITMMHPPGHVPVFPYCDIDFARETLEYHPAEKYKWFFQKECLKRFYPEYFNFPGSRNLPKDFPPRPEQETKDKELARTKLLYGNKENVVAALKYLNPQNKILFLASLIFPPLRRRRDWIFAPLLSLIDTNRNNTPFLE